MAKKDLHEFMSTARERWTMGRSADAEDRNKAEEDARFEAGDQWPEAERQRRKESNRPCMIENKLPVFVAQVVNDGRQNKPAIRCTPLDNGTPETAEFFQGRIRYIEYESDADIAQDEARRDQVVSGRGHFRVTTEYKPGSFDQQILIKHVPKTAVVWDPYAKEYDRSDANWCFVDAGVISKDEFERRYGKDAELVKGDFFAGETGYEEWVNVGPESGVRIAEYWVKEFKTRTLCRLADGSSAYFDELPEGAPVIEQREEQCPCVKQYIIDGVEIHDETEWLTPDIPVIPQWGLTREVGGHEEHAGLIREVKDPQRLVNLYVSSIAEQTAQLPKTPYRAPVGSIPEHLADDWAAINVDPKGYVLYNQYDEEGRPINAPVREVAEPPIQSLTIGLNQAIDAIKSGMGIFDASLGAQSNETAGIAIEKRQKEADNANFHFHDNEARSRRRLGRILIPLIKAIDAGERTVSVRSEDGKNSQVRVNTPAPYLDPATGKQVHHQLTQGDYGVAVSTGKSFTSQRDEAADRDASLIQAVPDLIWVIGDQYFRNLDSPGSEERADRMARAIDMRTPGLIEQKGGKDGQQPIPPQVQDAIKKRDQMIDQLTQELHQLADEVKTNKFQLDSNERIKMAQLEFQREELQANVLLAQEKMGSAEAITRLENELQVIQSEMAAQRAESARQAAADQEQYQFEQQQAAQAQQADQAQQQQQQQDQPTPGQE